MGSGKPVRDDDKDSILRREPSGPVRQHGSGQSPRVALLHFVERHAAAAYYALAFTISWGGTTMAIVGGAAMAAGPAGAGLVLTGALGQ
jgi:hypothetical protein